MKNHLLICVTLMSCHLLMGQDSFPPLENGAVSQTSQELWAGYDPKTEPLDVKVLDEWKTTYEGKDITTQLLSYAVGTFKGQVSRMVACYGLDCLCPSPKNQKQGAFGFYNCFSINIACQSKKS